MRALDAVPLKENDRRAIEAAATLLRAQFPVEEVILYGSKVRGDDDADSDIDLLVLTSRELSWPQETELRSRVRRLQPRYDVVYGIMVVPAQQWREGLYQALAIHEN